MLLKTKNQVIRFNIANCIMVRHNYLFCGLSKRCLFIYVFNLYIAHSLSMEMYNLNNCKVNLW